MQPAYQTRLSPSGNSRNIGFKTLYLKSPENFPQFENGPHTHIVEWIEHGQKRRPRAIETIESLQEFQNPLKF